MRDRLHRGKANFQPFEATLSYDRSSPGSGYGITDVAFSNLVTVIPHYRGMVAQSNVVPLTKAIMSHRERLAGREEPPREPNPTTKIITAKQMEVWMVEFAYKCVTQEY